MAKGAVDNRGQVSAKDGREPWNQGSIRVRESEVAPLDVVGGVFLLLAFAFTAATLASLFRASRKRGPYALIVGSGFALLAGCFVWFWLA